MLEYIAARLAAGRLAVIEKTNVRPESRRQVVRLAREHDVLPVAIVLNMPEDVRVARDVSRPERAALPCSVIQRHRREPRGSLARVEREGFRAVRVLRGVAEAESAEAVRERRRTDLRHLTGPFDSFGDIHGCRSDLETSLARLGYALTRDEAGRPVDASHPEGVRPSSSATSSTGARTAPARCHWPWAWSPPDVRCACPGTTSTSSAVIWRAARSRPLTVRPRRSSSSTGRTRGSASGSGVRRIPVSHYVLDGGALVVRHAGLPEKHHGRASVRGRAHALWGDTTGESDEYGLPVRRPWAEDHRGRATVVYGHTPAPSADWLNNTICLDTGAVFGGRMTALRRPGRELVDVPAERVRCEPARPLAAGAPGGVDRRRTGPAPSS